MSSAPGNTHRGRATIRPCSTLPALLLLPPAALPAPVTVFPGTPVIVGMAVLRVIVLVSVPAVIVPPVRVYISAIVRSSV